MDDPSVPLAVAASLPIGPFGFLVLGACIAAMLAATWSARPAGEDEYLLGGRRVSWPAAALALAAAEISVLTVLGIPAGAFRENWTAVQIFLGAAAGRAAVTWFILPVLLRVRVFSPYEFLGQRFGPRTRALSAAAFVATRGVLSAIRLLACGLAFAALMETPPAFGVLLIGGIGAAALIRGGLPAAVRASAVQTIVVLAVGVLWVSFLLRRIDGGLPAAWSLLAAGGKLQMFDFGAPPWVGRFYADGMAGTKALPGAFVLGFVGSAAAFGADHEFTQKCLATKGPAEARRAMFAAILLSFAVLLIYLAAGSLLFVFFKQNPGLAVPDRPDRVLTHFAATATSGLMRGALAATVLMSSVDLPLASIVGALLRDLRPGEGREVAPNAGLARRSAAATAGVVVAAAGVLVMVPEAVSIAFKIAAVFGGPLLGLMLLGTMTRRRGDGAAWAVFGSTLACAGGLALSEAGRIPADWSWSWLLPLGAAACFGAGWAATADDESSATSL